jgi:hypothetical protein
MINWKTLKGALRSKTMWWNVFLAVLASLELVGAHLTTLLGPQMAAVILLVGGVVNMVLRRITTMPLSEKAPS